MKGKNHKTISIDAEKAFDKNLAPTYNKICQQSRIRGNIPEDTNLLPESYSTGKNYKSSP